MDFSHPSDEFLDFSAEELNMRTQNEFEIMMTDDLEEREVPLRALKEKNDLARSRAASNGFASFLPKRALKFAGSQDHFFHSDISESLLESLDDKGRLDDRTLTLFEPSRMRLTSIKLRKAQALTREGLKFLKGHKVTDLTVNGLTKATVTDLIGCLDDWSKENLKHLNVANSTFVDQNKIAVVVRL